jgi:hypothetical protein
MPDLDIEIDGVTTRVFTLLHEAKPLLLSFDAKIDSAIHARYAGKWDLPVIGEVTPPSAVLVRPDGYVAWVGTYENISTLPTWYSKT